jgi:hypothetical protein
LNIKNPNSYIILILKFFCYLYIKMVKSRRLVKKKSSYTGRRSSRKVSYQSSPRRISRLALKNRGRRHRVSYRVSPQASPRRISRLALKNRGRRHRVSYRVSPQASPRRISRLALKNRGRKSSRR